MKWHAVHVVLMLCAVTLYTVDKGRRLSQLEQTKIALKKVEKPEGSDSEDEKVIQQSFSYPFIDTHQLVSALFWFLS